MNFKKGTIFLVIAWASVTLTGYVLNAWLGRRFGPEEYWIYGLIMSILLFIETFVITGLPHSVQKFVSADEQNAYAILWTAGQVQLVFALFLLLISLIAAPLVAALFEDKRLIFYFRIAVLDILFYGLFHLLVSFQNGLRQFGKQAFLYIIYSICKLGSVFLFVTLFQSLVGAFIANATGSFAGMAIGYCFLKEKKKVTVYKRQALIQFALPTLFYSLLMTLMLYIDLWVVSYYLGDQIKSYFVASSTIARIPVFLVLGLSAAVLPTISWYLASDAMEATRSTIRTALRFLMLIAMPLGLFITLYRDDVITFVYSTSYSPGASILSILIWGMIFLAFLYLLTTIIIADNRPKAALVIAGVAVCIDILLNMLLVPKYGAIGGAISTTSAAGIGSTVAMVFVYKRFRIFMPFKSIFRIGTAGILVWLMGEILDIQTVSGIWIFFCSMLLYSLFLIIFKEIRMQDFWDLFMNDKKKNIVVSP